MLDMYRNPHIKGFTTNPTLMRKAGITDYRASPARCSPSIPDRPISFEVFSDEFAEMERQATAIASWGEHVYVKIPVTNTRGEPSLPLIARLSQGGRQGQRHGPHDARPGARRRARAVDGGAPASSRCSPAASPTPAATRCR